MAYYDSIAKGYDELHKEEQLHKINMCMPYLDELPEGPLLDVGCGTGFSLGLLKEHTGRSCTGIDPSAQMLALYQGDCETVQGTAEKLPFDHEYYAAVVSFTAIQNFSLINEGVSEIWRVIKRGGRAIITCLKKSQKLKDVSEALGETFTVLEALEENKDIIFICRKD